MSDFALDLSVQLHTPEWRKVLRPYTKTVRNVCEAVLAETVGATQGRTYEIAVVLADDAFIRTLNHQYRGKDKPTNVLSFPDEYFLPLTANHQPLTTSLGDVVLAYETLEREARAQGKSLKAHAIHLLTHGVLHLLGFDHMEEKEAARMEKMEIKILKKQGIANPYL